MPAMFLSDRSKLAAMNDAQESCEQRIIRSWNANAKPWTKAVQTQSIASRKLVTDRAIIDAVCSVDPGRVLDVGCGEGWLVRALCKPGMQITGVDAVPELVAEATRLGRGEFHVQDYHSIANRQWRSGPCAAAVCNFSL